MIAIRSIFRRLLLDQKGATAIEYGLIVALLAVGIISGIRALGGGSDGMWTRISDEVTGAMNPSSS